ncbi:unnamed protein product [Staurois parvus]|uniref:Secreted protein n=1 Tax=Staurois parvus TaxID=386267 RepID=A0ABN9EK11_9NEOB|nr:unnamed protein product [Staurois parvus]
MTLESWVEAVLWPVSTARVPLSPRVVGWRLLPEPLPRGRLPPVARGPCPVVSCRLLPEPLPSGRLPPVARAPAQG